jgi:hypothetical protein
MAFSPVSVFCSPHRLRWTVRSKAVVIVGDRTVPGEWILDEGDVNGIEEVPNAFSPLLPCADVVSRLVEV